MPELPEVETTRRGLEPLAVGRRIRAAVVRNRAKRRVREWFRRLDLHGIDLVVIVRATAAEVTSAALAAALDDALRRAARKSGCDPTRPAAS